MRDATAPPLPLPGSSPDWVLLGAAVRRRSGFMPPLCNLCVCVCVCARSRAAILSFSFIFQFFLFIFSLSFPSLFRSPISPAELAAHLSFANHTDSTGWCFLPKMERWGGGEMPKSCSRIPGARGASPGRAEDIREAASSAFRTS